LKETIWPLIKRLSEAVLNVYGLILPKVLQLNNIKGFMIKGRALMQIGSTCPFSFSAFAFWRRN
jgi:hypothetical protein